MTPLAILYVLNNPIMPKMEYCCHIRAGPDKSSLSGLDRVQKFLGVILFEELFSTVQYFSYRQNTVSLLLVCRYFQGKYSDDIDSFVSPVLTFMAKTRHVKYILANHPHSLRILLVRCNVLSSTYFRQPAAL